MTRRRFGPYTVEVEREDKVFFPDAEITKGDLVHYYETVADTLLPHLKGRPLTLQRFPDGIDGEGFYQKETPDYFPDWIARARVPVSDGESQEQTVASNTATLVYLANQGTLTPHLWLSRTDDLSTPDRMVLDLDPSGADFGQVLEGARRLRGLLDEVGLTPFVMTTGSDGVHVWTPLRREAGFDAVRDFARELAECLVEQDPEHFTTQVRKKKRGGRVYLDVGRNAFGQTAVAPYAVRPHPGAPVATPLEWEELNRSGLTSRSFTVESVPRRLGHRADPWKGMGRRAGSLSRARAKWEKLDQEVCRG